MSILKKPEPTKKPNPTEQQLQKAKALIEAKRYEDARALLITIEHPTADKWLERLDKFSVPPAQPAPVIPVSFPAPTVAPQSFTVKLVVTLVLLWFFFIPGLIALTIFAKEAKQYPNAPGAGALLLLNKWIFWIFVALLIVLFIFGVFPSILAYQSAGFDLYSLF